MNIEVTLKREDFLPLVTPEHTVDVLELSTLIVSKAQDIRKEVMMVMANYGDKNDVGIHVIREGKGNTLMVIVQPQQEVGIKISEPGKIKALLLEEIPVQNASIALDN